MINNDCNLAVLASFTRDEVWYSDGTKVIQRGGPAFYISRALRDEVLPFKLFSGEDFDVKIEVNKNGEKVKVEVPRSLPSLPDQFSFKHVVVSPILDEWGQCFTNYGFCDVYVDVQGYVRDKKDFDVQHVMKVENGYCPRVLKATEKESSYIPKWFLAEQMKRCLVITKGIDGSDVYYHGVMEHVDACKVDNPLNTIGAGDTYFAYFVSSFIKNNDPIVAAKYASLKTSYFLKIKS